MLVYHVSIAYSEVIVLCSRAQRSLQILLILRHSVYQGVEQLHGSFCFFKAAAWKLCWQDCQWRMDGCQGLVCYTCSHNLHNKECMLLMPALLICRAHWHAEGGQHS